MTTRSSSSRRARAWVVAGVLVTSGAAAASPSAADVESARALYVVGKELRDSADLVASFEHFKAAHTLVPTPITALELGRAYALLGKPLEARAVLLSIERMPVAPDESKKAAASRVEARELADELGALTPALVIKVAAPPGTAVRVSIDGEPVPPEALAVPRKVNPGAHVVAARVGDAEKSEDVTVAEREVRTVSLDLRDAAAATAAPMGPVTAAPSAPLVTAIRRPSSRSPWLPVSLGAAGVFTTVGAATGLVAWSMSGRLHDACVDGRCPPEVHGDLSTVQTTSTIATVAFTAAAAALVTAAAIWLFTPADATGPKVALPGRRAR